MQIVKTEIDGQVKEAYVQQITVAALNDAVLSDLCDEFFNILKEYNWSVQFRDDAIPNEVRTRLLNKLFANEEVTTS